MKKLKQLFIIAVVAVAVIVIVVSIVGKTEIVNVGAGSGQDHYNYETFYNGAKVVNLTNAGGIITISTTSNAYTLTQAQMMSGNVISIANTAGSLALALTLPATSTMTKMLTKAGDSQTWFIENLHAAATTTTITTAAGIQLEGDTANDDIINGGVTGVLTCYRQASTDVVCQVSEKVSAE